MGGCRLIALGGLLLRRLRMPWMCGSMTRRLEITVSEETWGRLELARGHEPRASFVKRALESALGKMEDQPPRPREGSDRLPVNAGGGASAASSRAPLQVSRLDRQSDPTTIPGVETAADLLAAKQARMNADRAKKR